MEKILLVMDGAKINTHALHFACWLGMLTGSKITGVFLENSTLESELAAAGLLGWRYEAREMEKGSKTYMEREAIEKNILLFKETCEKNANRYAVHRDQGDPAKEIIAESRYADIIITDAGISLSKKFDGVPSALAKQVLTAAECPVIIAPESFDGIDEIIFTCDGSKGSMFAIKQFCYLFPQLDGKKVSLVQVDEDGTGTGKERQCLKEWLSSHYSSIGFVTLLGDAEIELMAHLMKKKNAIIVMGAYGRTAFSQYFRHSRAECLIETSSHAIFIAHC